MPINGPDISQCGGFLVDDGFSSGNYSNNQNQTIVICAVAPETIVNLYFSVFALGTGDYIEIFDGNTTTAPLIGHYTGTALQTTDVTSTNAQGCLTVRFVSDNSVVGNFAAEISCGPPCERPFAVVNTNQNPYPVLLCPGEAITFDAGQSQFAPGATMQSFEWFFDDGTTSTAGWPSVTHTFESPGAYEVQLRITDDNDCTNNNLTDYVILVSTYPDFSLMSPNFELCQGGLEYIGVNYFIPDSIFGSDSLSNWIDVPYLPIPDVDFGGALFIPDDQSECFSSELTFSGFDNGAVIDNINDLDYFFINFEHSFMGDITVTFICPNGQSIAVHQQGGGGTHLGEPIDIDSSNDPGIGYDYYWSPTATNGTWAENSGGTLPSGTYESVQPWNVLLGCPLNGTWTVEVCDMWASDNGFIFDWSMSFNPELYGELWAFTPIYGAGCDSSYWTGPFIVSQDIGCDFIGVEINTTGSYDYTYTVINNFGCTFDTTITVNVFVASPVTAGPDMLFSCDPIQLQGGIDLSATPDCDNAAGTYQRCLNNNETWIETICPDVVGDGVTAISIDFISGEIDSGDVLYVYNGPSTGSPLLAGPLTGNLSNHFYTATNGEGCLTILVEMNGSGSCGSGQFSPFVYEVVCGDSDIPYVWQWTPSDGLTNPSSATPTLNSISSQTEFVLTGYPQGYPGCFSADTMVVTILNGLPSAGLDASVSTCPGTPSFNMLEQLGGSPTAGGTWYGPSSTVVDETFDTNNDPMGQYEYVVELEGCIFSSILDIDLSGPDIFVSPDTTICIGGSAALAAWTNPVNVGIVDFYWDNGTVDNEFTSTPASTTVLSVFAWDGGLCISDTISVTVALYEPLTIVVENDSTVCPNTPTLAEVINSTGGFGMHNYSWTANNVSIGSGQTVPYMMASDTVQFCVTLSDGCESPVVQECMFINVPPAIDVEIDPVLQADCAPFMAQVNILTDQSLYNSAAWSFSNGNTSADLEQSINTFEQPGYYHLQLTLRNSNGCFYTEYFSNVIQVYPNPTALWDANPFATDVENSAVQFVNLSQGNGLSYIWYFGTGDGSTEQNPLYEFPTHAGNEYLVTLQVTDINGCYAEWDGTIDINDLYNIWIPNGFTPNNDRLNDVIFVHGSDISPKDFEWTIFNRWGDVVFQTNDMTIPWTGSVNNSEHYAPNGVYNYILKTRALTHLDERVVKGFITLVR